MEAKMCFRHLIGEEVFKINFDCSRLRIETRFKSIKVCSL